MYLVVVSAPIFMDGDTPKISTDWKRSVELLRDSFEGKYGHIGVLAPFEPAETAAGHSLETATLEDDGIELIPSYPMNVRTREFWMSMRKRAQADIRAAVARATVVHAGLNDMYRPFTHMAHCEAVRQNKPTVYVRDTDILLQLKVGAEGKPLLKRIEMYLYGIVVDRAMRHGVKTADLSLLKGSALMDRYAAGAKNAKNFQDTSYSINDLIAEDRMLARLDALESGARPFQFVYCGRLVARKGVDESLRIIAGLIQKGHDVHFHILGTGADEAALRALAGELALQDAVHFHGHVPYGPGLFEMLYQYDALLFTPQFEDTPRMIFDAYAAALPLFGSEVAYIQERHRDEHATILLPCGDPARSTEMIADSLSDPAAFRALTLAARKAGETNSAEAWYEARTQWTHEAVQRHGAAS